ncbi:MAG: hypothetical protein K8S16_13295 [Bacteroidales bacterium]|nr:hypothetical protein [Bacteroidales bacterium]
MKNLFITILLFGLTATLSAQSISSEVISASGDYFVNTNASLSWTLGEPITETFANGNIVLTQGFQQSVTEIIIEGISLDLLVYLEGPFSGSNMSTDLNTAGIIPLMQPYNIEPWNYNGSEAVGSLPNIDVVDWLLIELRDAANASSANETTTIARQAGFLLKDGSVVGLDGASILQFNTSFSQQLFVIVWHRNHLGIMSANGVTESAGIYTYDFSLSGDQVYGSSLGYKEIEGLWGMVAGDGNQDGLIDLNDKSLWSNFAGQKAYHTSDYNMNTQVNNADKNDKWYPNLIYSSQIPQ